MWKSTLYPDTDPDDDETLDLPTYRCYIDNLPDGYNQIIIVDVDNVLEDRLLEGDFTHHHQMLLRYEFLYMCQYHQ